jgi:hypothetical protein
MSNTSDHLFNPLARPFGGNIFRQISLNFFTTICLYLKSTIPTHVCVVQWLEHLNWVKEVASSHRVNFSRFSHPWNNSG